MKDIIPFQFQNHELRVIIDENGNPWWVAKDACEILEHSNYRMAVEGLDDDERGVRKVYTPGGEQDMIVVTESGLYTLIIRSNKPQAKPFRKWVTSEVLPAIRKTGCYVAPGVDHAPSFSEGFRMGFKRGRLVWDICDKCRITPNQLTNYLYFRQKGYSPRAAAVEARTRVNRAHEIESMLRSAGVAMPGRIVAPNTDEAKRHLEHILTTPPGEEPEDFGGAPLRLCLVEPDKSGRGRPPMPSERQEEIVSLHNSGLSVGEIAGKIGCARSTVRRILMTACEEVGDE